MTRLDSRTFRVLLIVIFLAISGGCSGSSGGSGTAAAPDPTAGAADLDQAEADGDTQAGDTQAGDAQPGDAQAGVDDDAAGETAPEATATPIPTLADDDVASSVVERAGFQFEDEQGNLVTVHGVVAWPETFNQLTDDARAAFPFLGDLRAAGAQETSLVALDVAMCAVGIDGDGSGTAEFFVHDSDDAALSTDSETNRGLVAAARPILQPGFELPATANCSRGWLPMVWNGGDTPTVARYVLTTRSSDSADPERHVYQWDLDGALMDLAEAEPVQDLFSAGQTVTFNQGELAESTVTVDGWAEIVGAASEVEGTRTVAVSVQLCPGADRVPEFGLGVDGWNLIAPLDGQDTLAEMQSAVAEAVAPDAGDPDAGEPETGAAPCVDGWLNFSVPFGAIPSSFFASDGANSVVGYAEWSLAGAAIAAPQ